MDRSAAFLAQGSTAALGQQGGVLRPSVSAEQLLASTLVAQPRNPAMGLPLPLLIPGLAQLPAGGAAERPSVGQLKLSGAMDGLMMSHSLSWAPEELEAEYRSERYIRAAEMSARLSVRGPTRADSVEVEQVLKAKGDVCGMVHPLHLVAAKLSCRAVPELTQPHFTSDVYGDEECPDALLEKIMMSL